jgi:hypothetical protein
MYPPKPSVDVGVPAAAILSRPVLMVPPADQARTGGGGGTKGVNVLATMLVRTTSKNVFEFTGVTNKFTIFDDKLLDTVYKLVLEPIVSY